jgi:ABC-2 type transport system ATP-binding protein
VQIIYDNLDNPGPSYQWHGYCGRLDLALALVYQPEILFLDDPTTGLDPASRRDLWQEVKRLNRNYGMTIFLAAQYLEEADELADIVAMYALAVFALQVRTRRS